MKIIEMRKTPIKEKIKVKKNKNIVIIGRSGGELELSVDMISPEASVNIYGILIGQKQNSFNIRTYSNHLAKNTRSRVHIKGVFMDKSNLDYEAMIRIDSKAQLSDAYLQNDNLIIGDGAQVNSSPQLEILADDVKVSHGVTISTIDEMQKYYIESRGISSKKTEKVLIEGFINDIIEQADLSKEKVSLLSLL